MNQAHDAAFSRIGLVWQCRRFQALDALALDAIYRARQQVFVVEQRCVFADADGHDAACWHLAAWPDAPGGLPVAYARIVPPGEKYAEASIGRVLTAAVARGTGLGRELVQRAIAQCEERWPGESICIGAQSRLEAFYASFGFVSVGEPYVEDDIPHTEMLRPAAARD